LPKIPVKIVSWEDVVSWTRNLSKMIIESDYQPDVIIGIARGGVAPARLLCDFLGVMDLLTIKVEHWVETASHTEDAVVKYPLTADLSGKRVLLVDDICDTGRSIIVSRDYIMKNNNPAELRISTMQYISPVAEIKPDYYVDDVVSWTWYMYPWNYMEDTINLIKKIVQERPEREWSLEEVQKAYIESYGVKPAIELKEAIIEGARRGVFYYPTDNKVRIREKHIM
jgi:hypoxanthine phosphoribosyltransferase